MNDYLFTKRWFRILFKGFLIILFAIFTLMKTFIKPFGLAYIFAMLIMFTGLLVFMHALAQKEEVKIWWVQMLEGLVDFGIGLCMLLFPNAALLFILLVLISWTIFALVYQKTFEKVIRTKYYNFIYYALSIIILIVLIAYFFYIPSIERTEKIVLMGSGILIVGINLIHIALEIKNAIRKKKLPDEDYN